MGSACSHSDSSTHTTSSKSTTKGQKKASKSRPTTSRQQEEAGEDQLHAVQSRRSSSGTFSQLNPLGPRSTSTAMNDTASLQDITSSFGSRSVSYGPQVDHPDGTTRRNEEATMQQQAAPHTKLRALLHHHDGDKPSSPILPDASDSLSPPLPAPQHPAVVPSTNATSAFKKPSTIGTATESSVSPLFPESCVAPPTPVLPAWRAVTTNTKEDQTDRYKDSMCSVSGSSPQQCFNSAQPVEILNVSSFSASPPTSAPTTSSVRKSNNSAGNGGSSLASGLRSIYMLAKQHETLSGCSLNAQDSMNSGDTDDSVKFGTPCSAFWNTPIAFGIEDGGDEANLSDDECEPSFSRKKERTGN